MRKRIGVSRSLRFITRTTLVVTLFAAVLFSSADARAGGAVYTEQAAFAGVNNAFLGYSVAIDGSTAIVGAYNDVNGGTFFGKGAAYVYAFNGSGWTLQQELTASDGVVGDSFGYTVAVSGNTALVGAVNKNAVGIVYVFTRSGRTWSQAAELNQIVSGACFGCSLALSGNTAIIGAPPNDNTSGIAGKAYVYVNFAFGGILQATLSGQLAGEAFGSSVGLSPDGNTAVVGAYGANSSTGRAYAFASGGGAWTSSTVLQASGGAAGDRFGYAVAAGNGTALIGAYNNGGLGAAYVFGQGAGTWTQQAKLAASDGAAGDQFGYAVALNGTTAVVGANQKVNAIDVGDAYVFTGSAGSWSQEAKLASPAAGQYFANSVAVSGTTVVVGALEPSNNSTGAAFIFAATAVVPALGSGVGALTLLIALGLAGFFAQARRARGAVGGRAALAALALVVPAATTACSGSEGTNSSDQPAAGSAPATASAPSDKTGTLAGALTLPGGQDIQVVEWTITGPNGAATVVQSGSINVQDSRSASFVAGGLPAAAGYRITTSATAVDGSVVCTGSANFNVVARTTVQVAVEVACSVATSGSQVTLVSGVEYDCATWNSVSANPLETTVGHSISLSATASAPIPSALTYSWTAPTGSFDTPTAATTQFTCTTVGPVGITLTVGDGPVPAGSSCNQALSTRNLTVTCD